MEMTSYCDCVFALFLYLSMTYWMFRKYPSNILKNSFKIPLFVITLPFLILFFMFFRLSPDVIEQAFYNLFGYKSGDILRITIGVLIFFIMLIFIEHNLIYIVFILVIEILFRFDRWLEKQK